jgi:hypothetical protein
VLYICIPSYNEAPTVGVLLWRIRKVFQEFSREYEVLVYDDGSTDATAETLAPYRDVMPLTVLGGPERRGYAAALDALARAVVKRTRYPRRDAAIFLQGDFTDQPEHIPELVKRFEGGADVVVAERAKAAPESSAGAPPLPVQRLSRVAPWVLKPFVSVPGVRDPFGSYRLVRISVLRDVVRAAGDRAIVVGDAAAPSWAANVELLLNAAAFARRVEGVELTPRYDVRQRGTRIRPLADALGLFRFARAARSRRLTPGTAAAPGNGAAREPAAAAASVTPPEVTEVVSQHSAPASGSSAAAERAGRPPARTPRPRRSDATREGASPASSASVGTPAPERKRSRRSRAERRGGRPSTPVATDEVNESESGAGTPAGPAAAGAPVAPAVVDDGAIDRVATPAASAESEADLEARRQRQRARRKRSRQRRAARDAARDVAGDDSTLNDGASAASNDAEPPSALAEAASPTREVAPQPPVEHEARAESRRDAEPAPTSPAASPVVQ